MGQLHRFIAQAASIQGFNVSAWYWLRADDVVLLFKRGELFVPPDARLVISLRGCLAENLARTSQAA